jgi:ATP-dependent protease ClpP protease subunit
MTTELLIYGEVLQGMAETFVGQLAQAQDVTVRINSPGGDIGEGLAIYSALKAHPYRVGVLVDGYALSTASVIAMAGQHIAASEAAVLMVHLPWMTLTGNALDMQRMAGALDRISAAMIAAYRRSGQSDEKIRDMLTVETWMTSDEALSLGFVDEVIPYEQRIAASVHFDLSRYGYRRTPSILEFTMTQANQPQSGNGQFNTQQLHGNAAQGGAVVQVDALAAIRKRNLHIQALLEPFKERTEIKELIMQAMTDPSMSVQHVSDRALMLLAARAESVAGTSAIRVEMGDTRSDLRAGAVDALLIRAGIAIEKPHPAARDFRGASLVDIARSFMAQSGVAHSGLSRPELFKAAMTRSDFPSLLADSATKALRLGYEDEAASYTLWTKRSTVPDFKIASRVILGSAPDLLPVAEHGEYKEGLLLDDKAAFQVTKFGRIIALSWEALVNDDLNAFAGIARAMGQAARRRESDSVYNDVLLANAGAGQTMQDNLPLFHANHGNLETTTTVLDAAALSLVRTRMRKQKAVGGGLLNLVPRYLIVPAEKETEAETLLAAAAAPKVASTAAADAPSWIAGLTLVVDPRLPATGFYVAASPQQIDTVEVAFLEGDNGPVVTDEEAFISDAKRFKIRDVYGVRALDYRGLAKAALT